jgi:phosphate transport system permease protein
MSDHKSAAPNPPRDLHEHLAALDAAGLLVRIDRPINKDTQLQPLVRWQFIGGMPEDERKLDNQQIDWLVKLKQSGAVKTGFNIGFFTKSDSTEPEQAGVLGAVVGSAMMLLVTALLAVPIGVMAAVYLEEFAPKGRWTDIIEVNINNLAAVPSIVYGLLGLGL